MVKRQDLKRRLKAADRRRNRRTAPAAKVEPTSAPPKVDVMALITSQILTCELGDPPKDSIAVAALRGCLRGTLPAQDPARSLAAKLNELPNQSDISIRGFRAAVQQLLDVAAQHEKSEAPDAFLQYLSIICPR